MRPKGRGSIWLVLLAAGLPAQTLYNGIRLPAPWPPRLQTLASEPSAPPYLTSPPQVIPIDTGRQLFVDDFLIERTTLRRTFHPAEYYSQNPVLKPDQSWEQKGGNPTAMVFSDGVWYDPKDRGFKMWYLCGYTEGTCYATSQDGVHWVKPSLDVVPGTNVVHTSRRDSATVWLDLEEKDPARRYKFLYSSGNNKALVLHHSADGIHWGEPVAETPPAGDRSTFFWNAFRRVWVYSIRDFEARGMGRFRRYWENADAVAGAQWKPREPPLWVRADVQDPRRSDLNIQPELYNLDAVAYESVLLGLFSVWRGQPNDRDKPNEVLVGFSRDGFHWDRPDRRAFIPVSERYGDWNYCNVQSAGGGCLVVGDKLYFYVSGRAGVRGVRASGVCSTGLATLRRDGFASMDAADQEGALTTRPVRFSGKHLFVNLDAAMGQLRVEALDRDGRVRATSVPVRADNTRQAVSWKRAGDLSKLAGQPVRFRFHLKNGRLYAFWVSPDPVGASYGYLAAGGPGFTGPMDIPERTAGTVLDESRERADLLDSKSPPGLRVVQITSDPTRSSWNVYTEAPVFTPDSRRFVFVREGSYWLCDIRDHFRLRQLTDERGATAPAVTSDGKWMYYIVQRPLELKRISLSSYTRETVLTIQDTIPGTNYRPSRIYSLSSVSSDGQKLITSCFLGDGKTPNAPWGLLVFDLEKRSVSLIPLGPDFNNAHPQYSRSKDPRFSRDILVQHNHGSVVDPTGKTLKLVGGAGADLHVMRDDGSNWRDIPIGRDGLEYVQGHQQWRGRMTSVLSAMSIPKGKKRILEGFPIPTNDQTAHQGAKIPGGKYVDVTRNLAQADFVHFSVDNSGMRIVSDTYKDKVATLVIGSLTRGDNPQLKTQYLLNTQTSFAGQPAHCHPFFSPDGRMVFFNSDVGGRPQVYMVTGYKFPR